MIRTATPAPLAALLAAPAMAACPAITSDTDPCGAAQVIQSENGRPAAADEWTPESFARTFGQTIVSLTDAGQSVHHQCNPTFCEDVITDGKIVAYRDTSAGKPDLSSVCYAVQGSPEIRKCLYNSGEKTLETHHNHEWNTLTVLVRHFDVAAPTPLAQQPATKPHTENKEHEQRDGAKSPARVLDSTAGQSALGLGGSRIKGARH